MLLIKRTSVLFIILILFFLSPTSVLPAQRIHEGSMNNPRRRIYLVGPEDILEISVWKEPDLNKQVVVSPDGKISFPLVGILHVEGSTIGEIEEEVKQRIQKYIPDAVVTVLLLQVNSFKVFVLGKVARPGVYTVGKRINVLQALSYAGGLAPFAKADKIIIIRNGKSENTKLTFNYKAIKKGESLEQNFILESGDVIIVP